VRLPRLPRLPHVLVVRFAAGLDRQLAGNEELLKIVDWWRVGYHGWRKWRESQPSADGHTINDLTENDQAVFYLGLTWSISPADGDLTEEVADPEVQKCWDRLKQARATLRAVAQAGEHAQA